MIYQRREILFAWEFNSDNRLETQRISKEINTLLPCCTIEEYPEIVLGNIIHDWKEMKKKIRKFEDHI